MATDSSILAHEIPWTEEPGKFRSKELQRVGHDSVTEHDSTHIHFQFSSFSHSLVSNSLRPHEPQHARPPCP